MSTKKLIAYELYPGLGLQVHPASRDRKWMDDTPSKFANRCLPMVIANQFGWEIRSTQHIRATWDGEIGLGAIDIEVLKGDEPRLWSSHFGSGILTFSVPYLFRTPENWNLMVRGPTNAPKDGIVALDGVVETDWALATFTMNWQFTTPCTIEFEIGEAVCLIHPIQRGLLDMFEPVVMPIAEAPEEKTKLDEWATSRLQFNADLKKLDEKAVQKGWEKDYMRAATETKIAVPEFRRKT